MTEGLTPEEERHLREVVADAVLTAPHRLSSTLVTDPRAHLRLILAAEVVADEGARLMREAVRSGRRAGLSWEALGSTLSISRQAAQQRFGGDDVPETGLHTVPYTSALNEMEVLRTEGTAGFHLVDFGVGFLTLAASDGPWEHKRAVAVRRGRPRQRLKREGWTYVGTWFPFHYFKRQVRS